MDMIKIYRTAVDYAAIASKKVFSLKKLNESNAESRQNYTCNGWKNLKAQRNKRCRIVFINIDVDKCRHSQVDKKNYVIQVIRYRH